MNFISLLIVFIIGFIPTLIFYLLDREDKKKLNYSALILTWVMLFGWAMFMEFAYMDMNIWFWIPEASVIYFLGRPIENMLFATFLIFGPILFYLWVSHFIKKTIILKRRFGLGLSLVSLISVISFSLFDVPLYTRYLPLFTFLIVGGLLLTVRRVKVNVFSMLFTIIVVLFASLLWNNLARIYNIWSWHEAAVFKYVLGMPLDEVFFVLFMIPGIILTYLIIETVCESVVK